MTGDDIINLDSITFTDGTLRNLGLVNTGMALAGTGSRVFDQDAGVAGSIQGAVTGTGVGLTKLGAGSLTLAAINTYTGDTMVNSGTLALADNAQLRFVIGATSGTNNRISDTGSVTLDGDFIIDTTLTDASALTTGTWTLVDASTLAESFSVSFTIPGWSEAGDVWTKTAGSKKYTFFEAAGILTLEPANGYASWAALNNAGPNLNDDHDNDSVSNGVEYFIGGPTGLTTGFTPLPGVTHTLGTLSITWTKGASYTGTYGTDFVVETSTTLAGVWAVQSATPAPGFTVTFPTANEVKFTFPADTTHFARLKVTGP